jgi:hypothetical protein
MLIRAYAQRLHAALERGNSLFEHCIGRIPNARVDVSLNFQIE